MGEMWVESGVVVWFLLFVSDELEDEVDDLQH
jgi:hypothetical protein